MAVKKVLVFFILIMFVTGVPLAAGSATDNPKNRIDFWQNNYDELKPANDPLSAKAHQIFERVLNAAGSRPGILPRLFIVNIESNLIPLAIAIPDGSIIISKKILNICYQNPQRGDDRLAFILGHEIAHQLKEDFWHLRFFQLKYSENKDALKKIQSAVQQADKILAKEIQADEHGIVYAAMAGFNTRAIIGDDSKNNFFEYVAAAQDPVYVKGVHTDTTHPSPKQRAVIVKSRLMQVVEKTDLYELGLLFYQAGEYEKAALFFNEFNKFFPSREVYHNLGTCYHQMALKYYREWKPEAARLPFKLSLAVDPVTRAGQIQLRGSGREKDSETLFKEHIEKALKFYKTAIDQDPAYELAYNNLGCALLIQGQVYKAIGVLQDAYKLNPLNPHALNNLGVAFYQAENPAKALKYLNLANQIDPGFGAPFFNLGKIAHIENNDKDAGEKWLAYLDIDPYSSWAQTIRQALSLESTPQKSTFDSKTRRQPALEVGAYEDEVPKDWNVAVQSKEYPLGEYPFKVSRYANEYMTVSQDDEIILIAALPACRDTTPEGLKNGAAQEKVAALYGPPENQVITSKGISWLYPEKGMAFLIQNKKMSSWMLF